MVSFSNICSLEFTQTQGTFRHVKEPHTGHLRCILTRNQKGWRLSKHYCEPCGWPQITLLLQEKWLQMSLGQISLLKNSTTQSSSLPRHLKNNALVSFMSPTVTDKCSLYTVDISYFGRQSFLTQISVWLIFVHTFMEHEDTFPYMLCFSQGFSTLKLLTFGTRRLFAQGGCPVHGRTFGGISCLY